MATVSAKVFKHHLKDDGTCNVKIVVYHKGTRKFIDTTHYVGKRQMDADFKIKDKSMLRILEDVLEDYRRVISSLYMRIDFFSCEDLRDYLRDKDGDIDFVKFCSDHIGQLRLEKRNGTANNFRSIKNSLIDYFKRESISINEIHSNMLVSYARYLKQSREMIRVNQLGKNVTTIRQGLSDSGLHNHMRDLRTLFNEARRHYNNDDLGILRIKHYPFARYKVGSPPQTEKRNITLEQLRILASCEVKSGSRAELARDLFLLSFYLCGINAVDLYQCTISNVRSGRLDYNRSKTEAGRKDNAFISIKIIDAARPLLEKYLGKLALRYNSYGGLDSALSAGMKQLRIITGMPNITFYWARHTFANTARNRCRISKDDVALALNHIDEGHRTTDIYIAKDWKIVDEVQRKVVTLFMKSGLMR